MELELNDLGESIQFYVEKYRENYEFFTSNPPQGAGYPKMLVSPYLTAKEFDVYLAKDGVVINQIAPEPDYEWYIAGGPALKVDYEPTRTPKQITEILKQNDLYGKPIGIYRIVSKKYISAPVWKGEFKRISSQLVMTCKKLDLKLNLVNTELNLSQVVSTLTFGAYGEVLDIKLPSESDPFGIPFIMEKIGFFPADLNNKRFFHHIEIYGHASYSAWDKRLIHLRVKNDLRRDFAKVLADLDNEKGGTISFGESNQWIENYTNRLVKLEIAINEFRQILQFHSHETEDVFHKLIEKHPVLLDVYGTAESKPKLTYPSGDKSPIGKSYVEPDFIVTYSDKSYKLVELERASKNVATSQGQPRAEVGQAAFQTAEWTHFISEHYNLLRNRYPSINVKCKTCLIMSRSTQTSFKNLIDMNRYKELIIKQYSLDEFLTYDDLFDRACQAYTFLTGLSPQTG